ncbi:Type IV pilus biogenesis protein PilO [Salmonella bongori]|nr:Type IV pilus biogenesis protein PilO [Salmonella bongori]
MNILFDIWCGMSRRDRVFCWGAGVVCLSLTAALLLCYPGWQTLDMQQARLRQQRDTRPTTMAYPASFNRCGWPLY